MKHAVALLGITVALAAAAAACGGGDPGSAPDTEESAATVVTGPTTKTGREPLEEQSDSRPAAPEIAGTTLDGETLALADLRGRPVFVKVFAGY
jgi:hypothetical protein